LLGAIDGILQRCLTKSPDGRFQSMAELAQELAAAEHALLASDAVIADTWPPDSTAWPAAPVVGALNTIPEPGVSATPVSVWAGVNLSNPTTLRDGSGKTSGRMWTFTASPLGRRRVVGLITATVLVAGAVAIVTQWRSCDGGPRVDLRGGVSTPPPSIDASIDASVDASPGASPAIDATAAFVPEISDAGVPHAPSPPPAVDAAVALPHRKLPDAGAHPSRRGGDLVGSAGSAARPPIDRED
jgi:hypothetical protein